MKFFKKSNRDKAKVSLVLLDWSVRESFHLLDYLSRQNVPRDDFEVIIVEYYSRRSEALAKFEEHVDTWVAMEMPESCYYHKHLMYNFGIVLAKGEIVMIGDSDAMVREGFIKTIVDNFERDPEIVYHMDQFRNMRRDLYPFCYPSVEEVLGAGCVNNVNGQTAGVLNTDDPIHSRNYGACMCAKRADLIAIGGADEHVDYLGHICGPYDMTFRLINMGRRELWEMHEFMYHTWHPGQAGADNYLGPHDGRHMSTTSLEALESGRVTPYLENEAIRMLRTGEGSSLEDVIDHLVDPRYIEEWNIEKIQDRGVLERWTDYKRPMGVYKGFRLAAEVDGVLAYPCTDREAEVREGQGHPSVFEGLDVEDIRRKIDEADPSFLRWMIRTFSILEFGTRHARLRVQKMIGARSTLILAPLGVLLLPFVLMGLALVNPRDLGRKLRDAQIRGGDFADALSYSAMTLYNVGRYGDRKVGRHNLLMVLSQFHQLLPLKVLGAVGLIPGCRLHEAPNAEEIARVLDDGAASQYFLLPRELYHKFHAQISSHQAIKHMIVI